MLYIWWCYWVYFVAEKSSNRSGHINVYNDFNKDIAIYFIV